MRATTQDALRHMVKSSNKTAAQVSRDMGKSNGYLTVMLSDRRTPRADLLARIARVYGYDLMLVGNGEVIILEG